MKKILLIIALILCIFQMVVLATAIDIGIEAIARANGSNNHTFINEGNPANESGTITEIEIYLQSAVTSLQVAIFEEVSAETWTTRSVHDCGARAQGYHAIAVNLEVVAGDHIGAYANQFLQYDTSGGSGIYVGAGDFIPCTNQEMTNQVPNGMVSLYGTGATVGWPHKWNTITIGKWNTKEFTKWNDLE